MRFSWSGSFSSKFPSMELSVVLFKEVFPDEKCQGLQSKKSKAKANLFVSGRPLKKNVHRLLSSPGRSETVTILWWQSHGLKWHDVCRTIWWLVGSVRGAAAQRLSEAQMKVSRTPARLFFPLFASLSVSSCLCLFVPLSLCLSPALSIHLFCCSQEILTDPLGELRDSISRQPNSTVVLGNSAALERWVLNEE